MNITDTLQSIENNEFTKVFSELYGTDDDTMTYQKQRYLDAVSSFAKLYPDRKDIRIFSASGRTEIGGNHTDHQHGCVLAAAVNLDAIGVVAFHNDGVIRIKSEGYNPFTVNLSDISVQSGNRARHTIIHVTRGKKFSPLNRGHFNFDDGNVTDWNNAYNGFNQGATSSSDTPNGQGLSMEFNGSSSYLQIPYDLFQSSNIWSFNMWFKTPNSNNHRTFFGTNKSDYYMSFLSNGKLHMRPYTSWETSGVVTSFFNNQWHMLTITYTGSLISLYIDGMLFETESSSGQFWWQQCTNVYIGGNMAQSSHFFFDGHLDNIRTYNRALTADEVQALYNAKQ